MSLKDIKSLLEKYRSYFFSRCEHYSESNECKREGGCACRSLAEMWAYTDFIIPKEFSRLSLKDFTGKIDEERVISEDRVRNAKQKISEFCFGKDFDLQMLLTDNMSRIDMDKLSVMDARHSNGTNLVIHGQQVFVNSSGQTVILPKGKTLLASIVMIEAIRRKLFTSNNANTFFFENFTLLKQSLKSKDSYAEILKESDWLVVDDININPHVTGSKITQFIVEILDEFFMYRITNNLPTILVFAFDIDNCNLQNELGYAISKIVSSAGSFVIKV